MKERDREVQCEGREFLQMNVKKIKATNIWLSVER